jgi:hypothetical protein
MNLSRLIIHLIRRYKISIPVNDKKIMVGAATFMDSLDVKVDTY